VAITVTLLESYPDTTGVPGVTVTCLAGCQNQTVGTTDNSGQTTLTGVEPLTVRAEKDGYISVEKQVSDGDNIVLQRELVAVTITVEHPYPPGTEPAPQHPGIPEVTVTCLTGCEGQQTDTTDQDGKVIFLGQLPLTIRAEKPGYIATEQQVSGSDNKVVLGHEWPLEAAESFSRLNLNPSLVLNWNEDDVLGGARGGIYGCNVVVIAESNQRRMLSIMEHEIFHAHQDETIVSGGLCPQRGFYEGWAAHDDGQEWIAATTADRNAGRLVLWIDDPEQYFWTIPAESAADYYSYWVRAKWPVPEDQDDTPGHVGVRELCYGGKSLRCQWMEKRFGLRPSRYHQD